MMFSTCFTLLFLAGGSLAYLPADLVFDKLIQTKLPKAIKNAFQDLTILSDLHYPAFFKDTTDDIIADVDYTEGRLSGLASAYRHSECKGPYVQDGIEMVNCTLGFNDLEVSYKGRMKYEDIPPFTFHVDGEFRNMLVDVYIRLSTSESNPELAHYIVRNAGVFKPTLRGLGPLEDRMTTLRNQMKYFMTPVVGKAVEFRFREVLDEAIFDLDRSD